MLLAYIVRRYAYSRKGVLGLAVSRTKRIECYDVLRAAESSYLLIVPA